MVCGWSVAAGGVLVWARAGAAQAESTSMLAAASIKTETDISERFIYFLLLLWWVSRSTWDDYAVRTIQTLWERGKFPTRSGIFHQKSIRTERALHVRSICF